MIVINEARFGLDAWAQWHRERIQRCPGHVWRRGPQDPAWICEHCPAWGRVR